jgi:hypothetical protein
LPCHHVDITAQVERQVPPAVRLRLRRSCTGAAGGVRPQPRPGAPGPRGRSRRRCGSADHPAPKPSPYRRSRPRCLILGTKFGTPEHSGTFVVAQRVGLPQSPVHLPAVEELRQVAAHRISALHEAAGIRVAVADVGGVAVDDAFNLLGVSSLEQSLGQLDCVFPVHCLL